MSVSRKICQSGKTSQSLEDNMSLLYLSKYFFTKTKEDLYAFVGNLNV